MPLPRALWRPACSTVRDALRVCALPVKRWQALRATAVGFRRRFAFAAVLAALLAYARAWLLWQQRYARIFCRQAGGGVRMAAVCGDAAMAARAARSDHKEAVEKSNETQRPINMLTSFTELQHHEARSWHRNLVSF
ncbi:hypothetical protein NPIL_537151 [Nephila pilipes]|uniref:Uncharacterized protein n=1 Tax=Nephila pilipes TaxID=299642 RepID=A0A8X6N5A3_NEPPI|nr:hypothetical protein NPIL_537151 [Nephila pilipes]